MLNRLTVSTLLKAVISSTALIVIIGFSLNAWSSWIRLQQADRMVAIAAASADLFKTMANIRADRSTTNRQLTSDIQVDAEIEKYIRGAVPAPKEKPRMPCRSLEAHSANRASAIRMTPPT